MSTCCYLKILGPTRLLELLSCAHPFPFLFWSTSCWWKWCNEPWMRSSSISCRNNFWHSCAVTLGSQESSLPLTVWYIDINPRQSGFAHNFKARSWHLLGRTHSYHQDKSDPQTNETIGAWFGQCRFEIRPLCQQSLKNKLLNSDFLQSRHTKWGLSQSWKTKCIKNASDLWWNKVFIESKCERDSPLFRVVLSNLNFS